MLAADLLQPGAGSTRRIGLRGPTASGYYLSMRSTSPSLYFYIGSQPDPGSQVAIDYPVSMILVVRVRDAQGKPVDGVPVAFELNPKSQLAGKLLIADVKPVTKGGKVQVKVWLTDNVSRSAAGRINARVENITVSVGAAVESSPVRAN